MKLGITTLIACAQREVGMRQRVYPAWVASGKMKQAKADHEIQAMQEIVELLQEIAQKFLFEKSEREKGKKLPFLICWPVSGKHDRCEADDVEAVCEIYGNCSSYLIASEVDSDICPICLEQIGDHK